MLGFLFFETLKIWYGPGAFLFCYLPVVQEQIWQDMSTRQVHCPFILEPYLCSSLERILSFFHGKFAAMDGKKGSTKLSSLVVLGFLLIAIYKWSSEYSRDQNVIIFLY